MTEFVISAKLTSAVKLDKNISVPFNSVRGLRQDDALSSTLYNFVMDSIVRKAGEQRTATIKNKSVQVLAFADDIDIIEHGMRDVNAAFAVLKRNHLLIF